MKYTEETTDLLLKKIEEIQSLEIKYDVPFEVTKKQHDALMSKCSGIVAGRLDESTGKYFIKAWHSKYGDYIKQIMFENL